MDATDHTTNHSTGTGTGPGRAAGLAPGDAFAPRPVGQPEPLTGDPEAIFIEPLDLPSPGSVKANPTPNNRRVDNRRVDNPAASNPDWLRQVQVVSGPPIRSTRAGEM